MCKRDRERKREKERERERERERENNVVAKRTCSWNDRENKIKKRSRKEV